MTRSLLLAALIAARALPAAAAPRDDPKGHIEYWIKTYGVEESGQNVEVARARRVFGRVLAVSEPRAFNKPHLVVLKDYKKPLANSLLDGSVVVSRAGVALAYQGVPEETGDARLAFVLGHELAHVTKDDFWRSFTPGTEPQPSPSSSRATEAKADGVGFVYALLAGYDPAAVLKNANAFLLAWAGGQAEAGLTHDAPAARVAKLRRRLAGVEGRLDTFRFGVRLYQLGRPRDALALLTAFQELLPRREVLNAVALCHYQLALQILAGCNEDLALRFRLPTRLDTETLKRARVLRGGAACTDDASFQHHVEEAQDRLRHALAQDASYLPTYLNASSAYILLVRRTEDLADGMGMADKGVARAPGDRALRINQAVARFAYGQQPGTGTLAEDALAQMRALAADDPADPIAAYNLAALQDESVRPAQAREAWEAFLQIESEGPFAALARRRLGLDAVPPRPPASPAPSPLPLGSVKAAAGALKKMQRRPLGLATLDAAVYRAPGLAALELNGGLEVVEEDLEPAIPPDELARRFGPPRERIATTLGTTLVYDGFAFDLVEGAAVRRVSFAR